MTNKDFFKKIGKKTKNKKAVDGYYGDKTGFYTLYKDKDGNMSKKKVKRKMKNDYDYVIIKDKNNKKTIYPTKGNL